VFVAAQTEVQRGRIWGDLSVSAQEFVLGYLAAAVAGMLIGFVAGWFKRANYVIDPWLAALYATPDVALIPLIVVWFGVGLWSKVFVVFLGSLFCVAINTLVGVQSTEARLLEVAASFGAGRLRVFRTVVLPGCVPFILVGLRQAAGRALVGVVLAELIASNQGIGFMMSTASATLNTGRLMLGILMIGAFGVLMGEGLRSIEQRFDVWRPPVREQ
jgi:ABC-type nitrate/sulfonate/bicarbonate transport system permease component